MLCLSDLDQGIAYSVIRSTADREVVLMHGEDVVRFWGSAGVQKFLNIATIPGAPGYQPVSVDENKFILVKPVPGVEVKRTVVHMPIAVFGNVLDFKPLIEWLSAM